MTDNLKKYREKRNFSTTPEPQGVKKGESSKALVYAFQKHRASHLHFDLRLERDGVLKSWAVPKTPPTKAGIKRLAVVTEDHPLGYEDFEGTIPEGNYGAGTVEIWDKGSYTPLEWKENIIVLEVKAKKLNGVFCLVKLKPKERKDKNWLFFKKKTENTKDAKKKYS